ncbi:unnamed protein product [Caenorhabditis auriculariae]|uniref:Uncharacterized protein n=1 Tax=Caenorhabditis auriculariae TaxID=2777116 RepID=A0A8S1HWQ4_9PELO|nr:unnamed protein product [Caenorhabditis auriculariae]
MNIDPGAKRGIYNVVRTIGAPDAAPKSFRISEIEWLNSSNCNQNEFYWEQVDPNHNETVKLTAISSAVTTIQMKGQSLPN